VIFKIKIAIFSSRFSCSSLPKFPRTCGIVKFVILCPFSRHRLLFGSGFGPVWTHFWGCVNLIWLRVKFWTEYRPAKFLWYFSWSKISAKCLQWASCREIHMNINNFMKWKFWCFEACFYCRCFKRFHYHWWFWIWWKYGENWERYGKRYFWSK